MRGDWRQNLKRAGLAVWSVLRPLLNATLLLAVVAAVAGLTLVNSTRSLVDDTMREVKTGLLHEIDADAKALLAEIDRGVAEFDTLKRQLEEIADDPQSLLDPETKEAIETVKRDVDRIADDLDRIASGQMDISQKTLEKLAVSLVRTYGEIRGCQPAKTAAAGRTR